MFDPLLLAFTAKFVMSWCVGSRDGFSVFNHLGSNIARRRELFFSGREKNFNWAPSPLGHRSTISALSRAVTYAGATTLLNFGRFFCGNSTKNFFIPVGTQLSPAPRPLGVSCTLPRILSLYMGRKSVQSTVPQGVLPLFLPKVPRVRASTDSDVYADDFVGR